MIVTIDGPAGAGKSSIARELAKRLGFRFLDTGAMYRAVALAALNQPETLHDSAALADLVRDLDLQFTEESVLMNGQDVTAAIRTPEVTAAVRFVADNLAVRAHLSVLQRRIAAAGRIVTEGRDQGTTVFPEAPCKIFLTATPEERARRRCAELRDRGVILPLEEVLAQQTERDRHDAARPIGGLARAVDAVEVLTDNLSPEDVLQRLEELVKQRVSQTTDV